IEFLAGAAAAVLAAALAARIIDEDPPHRLGGSGEEVSAAVPVPPLALPHPPQVGFVDQGGGLQRLAPRFVGQALSSQLGQFVVDQRQQLLGGAGIALFDVGQDAGNFTHERRSKRNSNKNSSRSITASAALRQC